MRRQSLCVWRAMAHFTLDSVRLMLKQALREIFLRRKKKEHNTLVRQWLGWIGLLIKLNVKMKALAGIDRKGTGRKGISGRGLPNRLVKC